MLPYCNHVPIVVIFDIVIDVSIPKYTSAGKISTSFNWSKATDYDISSHTSAIGVELGSYNVPHGLLCGDMHCKDVLHIEFIGLFYPDICNELVHAGAQGLVVCRTSSAKDYIVPGFNNHVRTLHTEACNSYII